MSALSLEPSSVSTHWSARAAEFHTQNPEIYTLLCRYARAARAAGVGRIGIELLWNRVRWDRAVDTTTPDEFKLNQNYKAWYAREIMRCEPDLVGIFETRRRKNAA